MNLTTSKNIRLLLFRVFKIVTDFDIAFWLKIFKNFDMEQQAHDGKEKINYVYTFLIL